MYISLSMQCGGWVHMLSLSCEGVSLKAVWRLTFMHIYMSLSCVGVHVAEANMYRVGAYPKGCCFDNSDPAFNKMYQSLAVTHALRTKLMCCYNIF